MVVLQCGKRRAERLGSLGEVACGAGLLLTEFKRRHSPDYVLLSFHSHFHLFSQPFQSSVTSFSEVIMSSSGKGYSYTGSGTNSQVRTPFIILFLAIISNNRSLLVFFESRATTIARVTMGLDRIRTVLVAAMHTTIPTGQSVPQTLRYPANIY